MASRPKQMHSESGRRIGKQCVALLIVSVLLVVACTCRLSIRSSPQIKLRFRSLILQLRCERSSARDLPRLRVCRWWQVQPTQERQLSSFPLIRCLDFSMFSTSQRWKVSLRCETFLRTSAFSSSMTFDLWSTGRRPVACLHISQLVPRTAT